MRNVPGGVALVEVKTSDQGSTVVTVDVSTIWARNGVDDLSDVPSLAAKVKKKKNPTNQQSGNAIENEFRFKNERSDLDERWTGGAGETEAAAAATVGGVAGLATAAAGGVAGPGGHTGRANFCGWA